VLTGGSSLRAEAIEMLPFTPEEFFEVFAAYNEAIWPVQLVAYALGAVAVALVARPSRLASGAIVGILGVLWLWTGIGYHWLYFASINSAAWLFGLAFVAQGLLLLYFGVWRRLPGFSITRGLPATFGLALVAYAAVGYPLVGMWAGHAYPAVPVFGVTPCPLTIFTLGVLLLATGPVPKVLLVVPLVWSLVGGSAAILLRVPQDWALIVAGLVGAVFLLARHRPGQEASSGYRVGR
jgi:hypothetical protein